MKTSSNLQGKAKPQRTCVACRQVKQKGEMVRVVRTAEGKVEIDIKGKIEGRGAYLCRERACWEKIVKSNQLEHALKSKIKQNDREQLGKAGLEMLKELHSG